MLGSKMVHRLDNTLQGPLFGGRPVAIPVECYAVACSVCGGRVS